jgi:hypothetical protein
MKRSSILITLSLLIAFLALIAAGAGLLWQDGGSAFSLTAHRDRAMAGVSVYGGRRDARRLHGPRSQHQ